MHQYWRKNRMSRVRKPTVIGVYDKCQFVINTLKKTCNKVMTQHLGVNHSFACFLENI